MNPFPEPAAASAGLDRRALQRFGAGLLTLARLTVPGAAGPLTAWVHDVSADGIAFDLLHPLAGGTAFAFRLQAGGYGTMEVRARVVHATAADGLFRIGCRLDEPLPADLLAALLRQLRPAAR